MISHRLSPMELHAKLGELADVVLPGRPNPFRMVGDHSASIEPLSDRWFTRETTVKKN